jgi:putative hemin transport protein
LVLDPDIDLRVFYNQWAMGFAVSETSPQGSTSHSLQFFDAQGEAIHKVYAKPTTQMPAWHSLVKRWLDDDQTPERPALSARATPVSKPDHQIDVAAFRADWAALRDTHDFFGMLRRHGVQRLQAMKLAEPRFAQAVPPHTVRRMLDSAALDGVSLMAFVGNPGMIQIHTGPIRRVEPMGAWLNVLDERFNLHLREDHIAEVWVVRKPTVDGIVTSIEVFDRVGDTIVQFFGERKPGKPEREDWRALVDDLLDEVMPCTP